MHLFLPASAYFSLPLFSLYLSPLLSTSAPSSFSASASSFPSQSLCLCLGFCISDCNFLFLSLSLSEVLSVLLFFSSCFFFFFFILSLPIFSSLNSVLGDTQPHLPVFFLSPSLPLHLHLPRCLAHSLHASLSVSLFLSLFQTPLLFPVSFSLSSLHPMLTVEHSFSLSLTLSDSLCFPL